jgi:hypothetical protein
MYLEYFYAVQFQSMEQGIGATSPFSTANSWYNQIGEVGNARKRRESEEIRLHQSCPAPSNFHENSSHKIHGVFSHRCIILREMEVACLQVKPHGFTHQPIL